MAYILKLFDTELLAFDVVENLAEPVVRITRLDENRRPKLDAKRCVGCHLCVLVCPQRAVVRGRKRIQRRKKAENTEE